MNRAPMSPLSIVEASLPEQWETPARNARRCPTIYGDGSRCMVDRGHAHRCSFLVPLGGFVHAPPPARRMEVA